MLLREQEIKGSLSVDFTSALLPDRQTYTALIVCSRKLMSWPFLIMMRDCINMPVLFGVMSLPVIFGFFQELVHALHIMTKAVKLERCWHRPGKARLFLPGRFYCWISINGHAAVRVEVTPPLTISLESIAISCLFITN